MTDPKDSNLVLVTSVLGFLARGQWGGQPGGRNFGQIWPRKFGSFGTFSGGATILLQQVTTTVLRDGRNTSTSSCRTGTSVGSRVWQPLNLPVNKDSIGIQSDLNQIHIR